nr:T9SS type A sorting domain-containing protein [Chitinophagaceae bacterium]
ERVKSRDANSAELLMYAVSNENPTIGHNYYRLQQKDIDGKIQTVSETIDLFRDNQGNIFSLSPNPSHGLIYFQAQFSTPVDLRLQVVDMQGKLVQQKSIRTEAGHFQQQIDLQSLPNGLYTISIRNNTIQWSQTVTKQ